MRLLLVFLLLFQPPPPTLYLLGWSSDLPVQIERVETTGGSLVQLLTAGDGRSGTVGVAADKACVTIVVDGHTTTGIAVRFSHSWDAGCAKVWLPVVGVNRDAPPSPEMAGRLALPRLDWL